MAAAAVVTSVDGAVSVVRNGETITVEEGMELFVTDSIQTSPSGQVNIRFADDTEVDLEGDTTVNISDFSFDPAGGADPSFAMHVVTGLARTATGQIVKMNPEGFEITTPLGTAGIRGTVIWTKVGAKEVVFTVTEMGAGHVVLVSTSDGERMVIAVPESGIVITESGAQLNMQELTPDQLLDFISNVLPEVHSSIDSSHGFFVLGDAQMLAAVGAIEVGEGIGFVGEDKAKDFFVALEELGLADADEVFGDALESQPFVAGDGSSGPVDPYNYLYGTDGNDTFTLTSLTSTTSGPDYVMSYGGNDIIHTGKGDDIIYSTSGTDSIRGGYGSYDKIYKEGALAGSDIKGDDEILDGVTADNDEIYIGVQGSNFIHSSGVVEGDADTLTGNALAGNDRINVYGTLAGATIRGDAREFKNVVADASSNGRDSIYVDAMTSGTIEGEGSVLSGYITNNANNSFGDKITVGSVNNGNIVGDFSSVSSSAEILNDTGRIFCDEITISGDLNGGSIYGDFASIDNGIKISNSANGEFNSSSIAFNDTITVSGTVRNATIAGDAQSINGVYSSLLANAFSDTINVGVLDGGNIYGEAASMGSSFDASALFSLDDIGGLFADSITINNMISGNVYGDFGQSDATGQMYYGSDVINIGTLSSGNVFGDVGTIALGSTGSTNSDVISIDNMTGGTVYGDLCFYSGTSFYVAGDEITVHGTMSGGVIYGDAWCIDCGGSAGENTITIGTLSSSGIAPDVYGSAKTINSACLIMGNCFYIDTMTDGTVFGTAMEIASNSDVGDNYFNIGTMSGGTIFGMSCRYDDGGCSPTVYLSTFDIGTMSSGVIYGVYSSPACNMHSFYGETEFNITNFNGGNIFSFYGANCVNIANWNGGGCIQLSAYSDYVKINNWNDQGVVSTGGGADTIEIGRITGDALGSLDFGSSSSVGETLKITAALERNVNLNVSGFNADDNLILTGTGLTGGNTVDASGNISFTDGTYTLTLHLSGYSSGNINVTL